MRTRYILSLLLCLIIKSGAFAQENEAPLPRKELFVTIFNNANAMPFSGKAGIIHTPIHPGISAGMNLPINKKVNSLLFQNLRLGLFHHRFSQTGIQLYTETGYRKTFKSGLTLEPRIGLGYLHSIPHTDIFELNDDGEYEKKTNLGRPQLMISAALSPGYDLSEINLPARIFLDYQVWFQTPFVNQYIPVLPNISLHLGVAWRLK